MCNGKRLCFIPSEGRTDKNFRRDANLKHAQVVKHEIEKEGLPAFELQV